MHVLWPFGNIIRWSRWFGRIRPFLEVFSEGQVKVRSKRSNFQIGKGGKSAYLDQFLLRNPMVSFVFYVHFPEVTKIAFEKVMS